MYKYRVEIYKIIDADTIDVVIDLGFRIFHRMRTRLAFINAYELNSTDPVLREKAKQGKLLAEALLPIGSTFTVSSFKPYADDKYGRWLIELFFPNGETLNQILLDKGLAIRYE